MFDCYTIGNLGTKHWLVQNTIIREYFLRLCYYLVGANNYYTIIIFKVYNIFTI